MLIVGKVEDIPTCGTCGNPIDPALPWVPSGGGRSKPLHFACWATPSEFEALRKKAAERLDRIEHLEALLDNVIKIFGVKLDWKQPETAITIAEKIKQRLDQIDTCVVLDFEKERERADRAEQAARYANDVVELALHDMRGAQVCAALRAVEAKKLREAARHVGT